MTGRKTIPQGQTLTPHGNVDALDGKVNLRHWLFAKEFMVDGNQSAAAIRAGYSPRTSRAQGSRLMKREDVRALIARARDEIEAELKLRIMGKEEVLFRLSEIAKSDIGDIDLSSVAAIMASGKSKFVKRLRQTTYTNERDGNITYTLDVEMYSAHDALRDLGKHHALFTDRVETGRDTDAMRTEFEAIGLDLNRLIEAAVAEARQSQQPKQLQPGTVDGTAIDAVIVEPEGVPGKEVSRTIPKQPAPSETTP